MDDKARQKQLKEGKVDNITEFLADVSPEEIKDLGPLLSRLFISKKDSHTVSSIMANYLRSLGDKIRNGGDLKEVDKAFIDSIEHLPEDSKPGHVIRSLMNARELTELNKKLYEWKGTRKNKSGSKDDTDLSKTNVSEPKDKSRKITFSGMLPGGGYGVSASGEFGKARYIMQYDPKSDSYTYWPTYTKLPPEKVAEIRKNSGLSDAQKFDMIYGPSKGYDARTGRLREPVGRMSAISYTPATDEWRGLDEEGKKRFNELNEKVLGGAVLEGDDNEFYERNRLTPQKQAELWEALTNEQKQKHALSHLENLAMSAPTMEASWSKARKEQFNKDLEGLRDMAREMDEKGFYSLDELAESRGQNFDDLAAEVYRMGGAVSNDNGEHLLYLPEWDVDSGTYEVPEHKLSRDSYYLTPTMEANKLALQAAGESAYEAAARGLKGYEMTDDGKVLHKYKPDEKRDQGTIHGRTHDVKVQLDTSKDKDKDPNKKSKGPNDDVKGKLAEILAKAKKDKPDIILHKKDDSDKKSETINIKVKPEPTGMYNLGGSNEKED